MSHVQYVSTFIFYDFFDLGLDNKVSGRYDNCNSSYFKSSVKGGVFLRECRECGMKKSI
ncbi:hypothetical protein COJ70_22665 [Priestia megaterium]|nr:hypothetical protein COJ70_22665 [Priestia megaterium]